MGIFGGIGKAVKGINWDRVATGLSAAGASAHGDHGTAAQIWGQYGKRRTEGREAEAERAQAEAIIQAAVRAGIPEQQARSLPPQTLAGVVAQFLGPQQPYRTEDSAGNVHERQPDGSFKPIFVDPNDRTFFDPSANRVVTVPNRVREQQQPPPPEAIQALRANPQLRGDFERKYGQGSSARVLGGGAGNGVGNFRTGFNRVPGGWSRF